MERNKIYRFTSKILNINQLTEDVKHFVLSTPDEFNFTPGQFASIILDVHGQEFRRPYSIASNPGNTSKNYIELCIKIIENGKITPFLNKMKPGNELRMIGPMGGFTIKKESLNKNITFISTGTGISPFRSMINYLLENDFRNKLRLFTGYRYLKDALYEDELNILPEKYKNFTYKRIFSREGKKKGYVQLIISDDIDNNSDYYICGLKEMIYSVKDLLLEKGISEDNIYFEKYD